MRRSPVRRSVSISEIPQIDALDWLVSLFQKKPIIYHIFKLTSLLREAVKKPDAGPGFQPSANKRHGGVNITNTIGYSGSSVLDRVSRNSTLRRRDPNDDRARGVGRVLLEWRGGGPRSARVVVTTGSVGSPRVNDGASGQSASCSHAASAFRPHPRARDEAGVRRSDASARRYDGYGRLRARQPGS
jgi:hypothetical protein